MNDIENIDCIWVEIETNEGGVDTTGYNGLISILDYEALSDDSYNKKFIKLIRVHWYKWPGEGDDWEGKKLIEYGSGDFSEYAGEMLIKTDTVVTIQRLKHGPQDPST